MKVKIPKKESDETPQHEKEEHKPIPKEKGPVEYPKDHQPGMRVPKGGSMCKNCEYVSGKKCTNEYFIKWHGNDIIPAPIDEYCSDFWEGKD